MMELLKGGFGLGRLSDESSVAQALKVIQDLRAEMAQVIRDVERITKEYDELWKVFITVLDACDEKELRIHPTQFLHFKDEYRVDRWIDPKTGEVVFRLLTLKG